MHAFDILADPVRRRILTLLSTDEHASGDIVEVIREEFGITQPAVSQHLKVLRENDFATVTIDGVRRLYALDTAGFRDIEEWLAPFRVFWTSKLDALATEVARGKKRRTT